MLSGTPRSKNRVKAALWWTGATALAVSLAVFGGARLIGTSSNPPVRPSPPDAGRRQAEGTIPPVGGKLAAPPASVRMLDAKNGYGESPGHPVAITRDAGATWTDATPRDAARAESVIGKSYFIDARTGWAFSLRPTTDMAVYGTRDGGRSWSKLATLPVQYGDGNLHVTFSDAQHGWFVVLTAGMGPARGELFSTSDGGQTWAKVADSALENSIPFGGPITAQKDGTLWLSGSQRAAAYVGGPGFIWLFRSADGGKTWQQVKLPVPAALRQDTTSVSPPAFFGRNGLLTVLYSSGTSVLYGSEDGGESWAVRTTLPAGSWPVFADAMNGWQTDGRLLHRTSDGGRSWQRLAPDPTRQEATSGRFLSQLHFIDAQRGWAVLASAGLASEPSLLATSDGGETWKTVP